MTSILYAYHLTTNGEVYSHTVTAVIRELHNTPRPHQGTPNSKKYPEISFVAREISKHVDHHEHTERKHHHHEEAHEIVHQIVHDSTPAVEEIAAQDNQEDSFEQVVDLSIEMNESPIEIVIKSPEELDETIIIEEEPSTVIVSTVASIILSYIHFISYRSLLIKMWFLIAQVTDYYSSYGYINIYALL